MLKRNYLLLKYYKIFLLYIIYLLINLIELYFKVINDFKEKWYSQIPTNLKAWFLQETIESFRIFDSKYSNNIKDLSYYSLSIEWRVNLGYRDKSDDPNFDSKCYFHYNIDMQDKTELANNKEYQDFIGKMSFLYEELDIIIKSFLNECELNWILKKSDFIREDWTHNSILRILNYKPKKTCKTLAKAHIDRGAFTFTIYETHKWLQFLSNNKWIDINYKPWILNLFPWKYWNMISLYPILWTTHQVIRQSDNTQRSSIVMFVTPLKYIP